MNFLKIYIIIGEQISFGNYLNDISFIMTIRDKKVNNEMIKLKWPNLAKD